MDKKKKEHIRNKYLGTSTSLIEISYDCMLSIKDLQIVFNDMNISRCIKCDVWHDSSGMVCSGCLFEIDCALSGDTVFDIDDETYLCGV